MEEEIRIWYLAAEGIPFHSVFEADSEIQCDPQEPAKPGGQIPLRLPDGGEFLDLRLEADIVDASGPGSGYATFMFRPGSQGAWMNPHGEEMKGSPSIYVAPPQEETRFNVSEPTSGHWAVWVWPHGPAQGTSDVTGDLADMNRFGVEC